MHYEYLLLSPGLLVFKPEQLKSAQIPSKTRADWPVSPANQWLAYFYLIYFIQQGHYYYYLSFGNTSLVNYIS